MMRNGTFLTWRKRLSRFSRVAAVAVAALLQLVVEVGTAEVTVVEESQDLVALIARQGREHL